MARIGSGPVGGTTQNDTSQDDNDSSRTNEQSSTPDSGGRARQPPDAPDNASGSSEQSFTPDSGGTPSSAPESTDGTGAPQGDGGAFDEAKDISRESVATGSPVGGGLETQDDNIGTQAQDLEQDVISSTPGVTSEEQVRVTQEGDKLVARLTDSGRLGFQREMRRRAQDREETVLRGVGIEGTQETGYRGPRSGEPTKAERDRARTVRDTFEGLGIEGTAASGYQGPRTGEPTKAERDANSRVGDERAELAGAFTTDTGLGREQSPGIEDRAAGSKGRVERAGDIDWSFGYGGPEDEVEQAYTEGLDTLNEKAGSVGLFAAGLSRTRGADYDPSEADEDAALDGALDPDETYDAFKSGGVGGFVDYVMERGRQKVKAEGKRGELAYGMGRAPADLATGAVSLPKLAMEGLESKKFVYGQTRKGQGLEALGKVKDAGTDQATAVYEGAKANPYVTGGGVVASLGVSSAAFKAARAVGPRTSAAARYTIQPGEELLGKAGYKVTRAATNERRAQQLFPDEEPLLFSEEAAIRAGRHVKRTAGDATSRQRLREFAGDTRAQGELVTETELEEDDDLGVPDDDPFRVSDKRLYDPAREFGDADDPSRFIDETRSGQPLYEQDIEQGIAGQGNPQTFSGEGSFEENFNRAIRERQAEAQQPEARVDDEFTGTEAMETSIADLERQRGLTRTDTRQRVDSEFGFDSDIGFDSLFEFDGDVAVEGDVDTESASDTETRLESLFELESETETEQEVESEFETEVETEVESEFEQETEAELEHLEFDEGIGAGGLGLEYLADEYSFDFIDPLSGERLRT